MNQRKVIAQRFEALDTSLVADVLDELDLVGQGLAADFRPYPVDAGRLVGWAYTIQGEMSPYEGRGDVAKMRACQGVSQGEVAVWSGDGEGVCYFGELIALGMKERGCTGALVAGGVRDVRWLRRHEFPVFARYCTPVQSIGRWRVTCYGEPVYMAGATTKNVIVRPGDFILGDEDGVLVIPADTVEEVLSRSERLLQQELRLRKEVENGLGLEDALEKYGHV